MEIFEILDDVKLELIEEAKKKKKRKLFKSPIVKGGWLNKNGRVYPLPIVKKMVSTAKEAIEKNKLYGSSFHPKDGIGKASNVAWILRDLEMVGDEAIVTGELLDTSKGKDLQVILNSGGSLGLSIRGHGDLKDAKFKLGDEEVDCREVESFVLTGCDVVLNPSFDTQFSQENMFESIGLKETTEEAKNDEMTIQEKREDYKKSFKKIFDEKQDAGEIELEETFESWLEDAGLDDDEIDRLILHDQKTLGLSDLQLFEEAFDSGYSGTFEQWKEAMKNEKD